MNEKFLHFIWQNKLFTAHDLQTTTGEAIEIIDVGRLNSDAGPDFFNAKVKINDTLWVGNVEIHIHASDWQKHKHQHDKAYDSVILHVVHRADAYIYRTTGEEIPQTELQFAPELKERYHNLLENKQWIACADKLSAIDPFQIRSYLSACLSERLAIKTEQIFQLLEQNQNNWEEAFYIALARNFGFNLNSLAFEQLAKSLPLAYLGKHKNDLFQIEALLFGQAGFLENIVERDEYQTALAKEYKFLHAKFNLQPIELSLWKFLRLRPTNFPTIRIAQFASLIHQSSKLFSKMIEQPEIEYLQDLFSCETSPYWNTHYMFGEESPRKLKKLGKSAINVILINTVVPFLFCYGRSKENELLEDTAMELLEKLPPEKNSIITAWQLAGITAESAHDTQALLQIKKHYCDEKKCLRCRIGHQVLTK